MQSNTADNVFGKILSFLLGIGIACFFGYLIYLVCGWLLFGPGIGIVLLGLFAGTIFLLFGWFPEALSRRTGQTKWQAERSIQLFILFSAGIVLGFYWIPKHFNIGIAWYWRVLLGVAVGLLGLMTRRFR